MRRIILLAIIVLASSSIVQAQSVGYVNTDKILEKIPDYAVAQQQIDRLKKQYEAQVETEMRIVENLYNRYQSEKSSLPQVQREIREKEIIAKERTAKELQKSLFGQDGTLSVASKQLLDPIKNKVQSVIEQLASENGIILVIDIATAQGVIYYNPAFDLSSKVLQKLNIN